MKKILTVFAILSFGNALFAQNLDSLAIQISNAYNKAYSSDSLKYKQDFFNIFPDNFQLFNALYGWNHDKEKPRIMYFLSDEHISFFCTLDEIIPIEQFSHKIIKLSLNGYWDADAINYLQHCINDFVSSNLQLFIDILSQYSEEDMIKFWTFFYDTLYPDHPYLIKFHTDISDKIKKVNFQMYQIMEKGWEEMISKQEEW